MKERKHILIIGATGMLGHALVKFLHNDFKLSAFIRGDETFGLEKFAKFYKNIDVTDDDNLKAKIIEIKPDVIINAVGVIKQSNDLEDKQYTININGLLPHQLAVIANGIGARFIHFSTDCVFKGDKGQAYSQQDEPDSKDLYGLSKLLGEVDYENAITLRTSIIGNELRGKKSLLEWVLSNKGKSVDGFEHALYTGFTTYEMSKILKMLINDFPNLNGVWQVSSDEISKYDLLKIINDVYQLNIKVNKNTEFKCDRRLNSLDFREKTGYNPPSWQEMIEEYKKVTSYDK